MLPLKSYGLYICNIKKIHLAILTLFGTLCMSINFTALALTPSTPVTDQSKITIPDAKRFINAAVQFRSRTIGSTCSGMAIESNIALTARHCLVDDSRGALKRLRSILVVYTNTMAGATIQTSYRSAYYSILLVPTIGLTDLAAIRIEDEGFPGFANHIDISAQEAGVYTNVIADDTELFKLHAAIFQTGYNFATENLLIYYATSEEVTVARVAMQYRGENADPLKRPFVYDLSYIIESGDSGGPLILCDYPKCSSKLDNSNNEIQCKLAGIASGTVLSVPIFTLLTSINTLKFMRASGRVFNLVAGLFEVGSIVPELLTRSGLPPPGGYPRSCDASSMRFYYGILSGYCKNEAGNYILSDLNYALCAVTGKLNVNNLNGQLICD